MSTPEFQPQPSTAFSDQPEPSGPDHNGSAQMSTEDIVRERVPGVNRKNPPRSARSTRKEKPSGLGLNSERSSGIPKLAKAHAEQIATLYTFAGASAAAFNMRLAKALATGADDCANAWVEWANSNDKLRRRILAMLEGGQATKVFVAHAPILLAAAPEGAMAKMLARFGFAAESEEDT